MANLTSTTLGSLGELRAIEAEWRVLADERSAGPFMLPSIVIPWWEHLGKGQPLVVAVRDDGGRLVGLALLHERRLGAVDLVRWMGHGLGAVAEVLEHSSASGAASAVWGHLAGSRRRVLQLIEYRLGGAGLDALRRTSEWATHPVLRDACPVIDLRGHASVESFLAEPGRRKLRQNMARHDRLIERETGRLVVEVHTDEAAVLGAVDDLTLVHDRAEEARERLHFLAGVHRGFTVEALRRSAAEHRVAVFVVRVDDQPVGMHVVVTAGKVAYAWLARSDPAAAAWAPGHLMIREVVRWAIEQRFESVDLQLGDDPYKLRWSSSTYDTVGVLAACPSRLAASRAYLAGVDRAFRLRSTVRSKVTKQRG